MESLEKNIKNENGMSMTLPKLSENNLSKSNMSANNNNSFYKNKFDIFDTESSIISEFMSLSLDAKIQKFKSNTSLRKLKDKNSSNTFLHYICRNEDNFPLLEIIKPSNKEINIQNNLGQTPFHIAIINKNKKTTKYLVENGANTNISDNNLNMSLHLAVMNNDLNIIKLLLDYKANPLLMNKNNETSLDIAVKLDYKECINLLKDFSLINEARSLDNKNEKSISLKNKINENKININGNRTNKNNSNNNISSHKIIHFYKKRNIMTTPQKKKYITNFGKNITFQGKNIFLTSKKPKKCQRNKSTTEINFPINDKIYTKKIVNRSQSTTIYEKNYNYQNKTDKIKKIKIENNDNNEDLKLITIQNNSSRKTDFIIKNEIFLESGNESEEEEESVIRENINNKKKIEKIIESLNSLKTVKITPLTETNNKINPFIQIDSFVSSKHKNNQIISESNGKLKEDELIIVNSSIDINKNTNKNLSNNNIIDDKSIQKKEIKNININQEIKDIKEDLYNFLKMIDLDEYIDLFINNGYGDISLLINQMKKGNPINDDILKEIGMERPGDRAKILIRLQECACLFDFEIPFESVYHINRTKFEFLDYDFHVKALQDWLKKLNLEKYLGNFYNNGYYSPELIFIQNISSFPLNDTIIKRDLKIESINDIKIIMNSISEDSKNYISELKNKYIQSKNKNSLTNKENNDIKCIIF